MQVWMNADLAWPLQSCGVVRMVGHLICHRRSFVQSKQSSPAPSKCLLAWHRSQQRQLTHLICSTDPHLEETLGLGVEGTTICESGQQDVGSPVLVHPVIPVLPTHKVILNDSSSGGCRGKHLMCTSVQHQRSITETGMLATRTVSA